jgi:hypothetical protein
MKVCQVLPASPRVTYLVMRAGDCRGGSGLKFVTTPDDGVRWRTFDLPNLPSSNPQAAPATVLDEDTVVIPGYITHDGGRSWQPFQTKLEAPIESVPPRWVVMPAYFYALSIQDRGLAAVDPQTGRIQPLAHRPAPNDRVTEARDGSFWTTPGDRGIAVSHDRGRSWTSFTLPEKDTTWPSVTSFDGRVGYAVSAGTPSQQTTIYRTDDGGAHWRQWSTPAVRNLVFPELLPNGSLVGISWYQGINGAPMMLSTDAGRTFHARYPGQLFQWVHRMPGGGYVAEGVTGQGTAAIRWFTAVSADGVTFREVRLPDGANLAINDAAEEDGDLPSLESPAVTPSAGPTGSPSPGR